MEKEAMIHIINYKEYLEREILSMKNKLEDYNIEFENVKIFILKNCKHNWVNDNIDQIEGIQESIPIKYCDICLSTQKI